MADEKIVKQRGTREPPNPGSAIVMSMPIPAPRKAEEYLKAYSGYAYTSITAIAHEVASIKLRLFERKIARDGTLETEIVHQHELLSFLQFVNPLTTFYDLAEATQSYLELVGEAFWIVLREGDEKGMPKEAYLVRPDWMKVVTSKTEIVGSYIYDPGGTGRHKVKIPKENVIHFKYFNPTNPYRGKGSIQAAAMPLDIHTFAQEWNRNFFFNSAEPGLIFTSEQKISPQVIQRFMTQWKASHQGRGKSSKVAFLSGGFKVDKTSASAKELDFANLQKQMRDDILAVFQVPKSIIGLTEDVNRANAQATIRSFMKGVITPRMRKFVEQMNEFLLPMFEIENMFLDFEDPTPEDTELNLKRYENGRKYGWLTVNEVRVAEGLEPVEGGDELEPVPDEGDGANGDKSQKKLKVKRPGKLEFKHMVNVPVKAQEEFAREKLEKKLTGKLTKMLGDMVKEIEVKADEEKEEQDEDAPKPVNTYDMDEDAREAYWRQFVDTTEERELLSKKITINIFEEEEMIILAKLEKLKHWRMGKRKGKASSFLQPLGVMAKLWLTVYVPFLRDIVISVGSETLDFLGIGGNLDMATDDVVGYLSTDAGKLIDSINETTRTKLGKQLTAGFAAGEGIDELRKRVQGVFTEAKTSRTEMIARSEVLRASNFATVEAYKQSEFVTGKEWLTAIDDRVCPWCNSLDGKIVELDTNYFDKGDRLTVDDQTIKFDVVDVEHPPLHPNCRCTLIPVVLEGGKSFKGLGPKKVVTIKKEEKVDVKGLLSSINKGIKINLNQAEKKLREKLEVESKKIEKRAKIKGDKIIEKATEEADILTKKAKKDIKSKKTKITEKSKKEAKERKLLAKNIIEEAEKKARKIKRKAKTEAKEKEEELLSDLKELRNRAREALK